MHRLLQCPARPRHKRKAAVILQREVITTAKQRAICTRTASWTNDLTRVAIGTSTCEEKVGAIRFAATF